jgi:hypothetical protein
MLAILISPIVLLVTLVTADLGALRGIKRAFRRARAPTIIEVAGPTLSLLNIETEETYQNIIRPRKDIYDVRFIEHSGNLFIRAHGHEIIDIRPFHDPRILRWLAQTLHQALELK